MFKLCSKIFAIYLAIKNTFILEGNITDIYPVYTQGSEDVTVTNFVNLNTYLDKFLNKHSLLFLYH